MLVVRIVGDSKSLMIGCDDMSRKGKRGRKPKCVYATYTPEEIFSVVRQNAPMLLPLPNGETFVYLRNNSKNKRKRLVCFMQSTCCVACGKKGEVFRLEEVRGQQIAPSLVLYAADGTEMTMDHILPQAKGGSHRSENLQTMCADCNHQKGSKINSQTIFQILQAQRLVENG